MRSWALALMHAAPTTNGEVVAIEWLAPAECPSADDVRARAEALAAAPAEQLRGQASVTLGPSGGYVLELGIDDTHERFEAPRCEQLADLAALMIAVAADPVAVATRVGEALSVADPIVPPPAIPTSELEPTPRVAFAGPERGTRARRRPPWNVVTATHAVAGVAQLPVVDAGIDLAVALELPRFALQARGAWLSPREAPIPGQPIARGKLSAANASLRACSVWRWSRIDVLGCGGIELGGVFGRPIGAQADPKTSLWVAALASVGVRGWVHPRVALELGADLLLALRRPSFALRDAPDDTVSAGIGGARGWAGIAVRLGRAPKTKR